jgi:hypothetical protein
MLIQKSSLPLVALLAVGSCGKATQPKPQCKAQQEEYAARYFDPEMSGTCADGQVLVAEGVFLQYYRPAVNGIPKIAIEAGSVADALGAADERMVTDGVVAEPEFSIGSFADIFPDDNDMCEAKTLTETSVSVPMLPAMPPDHPDAVDAVTLKYKWSNVKMLTKPLSNAIHFGANLTRTDGECVVSYKVEGIYPVVHCGNGTKPKEDEMGMPIPGETEPDPESGDPDPSACEPSMVGADHGSGLSPEIAYECEATTLLCVPKAKSKLFFK